MSLPSIPPFVPEPEAAALFLWATLHASGGSITRSDLARVFAMRANPDLARRRPLGFDHWRRVIGSRTYRTGHCARTIADLALRCGVLLDVDGAGRSTVSTSQHTPDAESIDPWFRFEAQLMLEAAGLRGPGEPQ